MTEYEENYIDFIEPVLEQKYQGKRFTSHDLEEEIEELDARRIGHSIGHVEKEYDAVHKINRGPNINLTVWFYNPKSTEKLYKEVYQEKLDREQMQNLIDTFENTEEQEPLNGTTHNLYRSVVNELEENKGQLLSEKVTDYFNQHVTLHHEPETLRERAELIGELRTGFIENYGVEELKGRYVLTD